MTHRAWETVELTDLYIFAVSKSNSIPTRRILNKFIRQGEISGV